MAELVMTAAEIAADPARWLEQRRQGVTATDAATILGVSPWDSPFALWHRKKGNLPDVPDNDRMRLGRYLEGYVQQRFRDAVGSRFVHTRAGGLWRDGWRMATPDYIWFERCREDERSVLECKSVGSWDGWGHGLGKDHSPDCERLMNCDTTIPAYVRVQALWQADVLGVPLAHVAALHRLSGEFRWYTLDAWSGDEAADATGDCEAFHRSLRLNDPPPVDGAEATTAALKQLHQPADPPRTAFLDRKLVNQWESFRQEAKHWDEMKDHVTNEVRAAMGDAKYARYLDEEGQEWQIATRTIGKRAGYWVPPGETDTLRYGRKAIND